jgi:hypothetical protein
MMRLRNMVYQNCMNSLEVRRVHLILQLTVGDNGDVSGFHDDLIREGDRGG